METVFKSKMNKVLNRMEDPRKPWIIPTKGSWNCSECEEGVAEVASSKKRLNQRAKLAQNMISTIGDRDAVAADRRTLQGWPLREKPPLCSR